MCSQWVSLMLVEAEHEVAVQDQDSKTIIADITAWNNTDANVPSLALPRRHMTRRTNLPPPKSRCRDVDTMPHLAGLPGPCDTHPSVDMKRPAPKRCGQGRKPAFLAYLPACPERSPPPPTGQLSTTLILSKTANPGCFSGVESFGI